MKFWKAIIACGALLNWTPAASSVMQRDAVPNCDDTSQSYSGPYSDGQGTYVTSDGITHPYVFPKVRKCWWDYFIVDASVELLSWQKASGDIYCTGTQTCIATKLSGNQVCQSRSESVSADVGLSIEGFTMGLSVQVTNEQSRCVTASDTTACTWNDAKCHCIWTQQQVLRQRGYRRHRCNYGATTHCMADWSMDTPTNQINYGCGSACSDTNSCGKTDGSSC